MPSPGAEHGADDAMAEDCAPRESGRAPSRSIRLMTPLSASSSSTALPTTRAEQTVQVELGRNGGDDFAQRVATAQLAMALGVQAGIEDGHRRGVGQSARDRWTLDLGVTNRTSHWLGRIGERPPQALLRRPAAARAHAVQPVGQRSSARSVPGARGAHGLLPGRVDGGGSPSVSIASTAPCSGSHRMTAAAEQPVVRCSAAHSRRNCARRSRSAVTCRPKSTRARRRWFSSRSVVRPSGAREVTVGRSVRADEQLAGSAPHATRPKVRGRCVRVERSVNACSTLRIRR